MNLIRSRPIRGKKIHGVISTSLLVTAAVLHFAPAHAGEAVVRTVILDAQSRFVPEQITVPRNVRFLLIVRNESAANDEIESDDLGTEKAIKPGQSLELLLGPLKSGTYRFMGDMHRQTAQGQIIVK